MHKLPALSTLLDSAGLVANLPAGAGSGFPDGDRSLRQALERQRFETALLDGRPVQVWLRDKQVELVR